MALLRPTRLLISKKSATYTIIWQVRVITLNSATDITQGPVSSKSEVTLIHIGEPLSEAEVLQILDSIKYDSRGVIEIDKLVDIIFDV